VAPPPGARKGEKKDVQLLPGSGDGRNSLNLNLLLAAVDGNEGEVKRLLEGGANPDFQEDKYTWTAGATSCSRAREREDCQTIA
jgi:hypothetical protein